MQYFDFQYIYKIKYMNVQLSIFISFNEITCIPVAAFVLPSTPSLIVHILEQLTCASCVLEQHSFQLPFSIQILLTGLEELYHVQKNLTPKKILFENNKLPSIYILSGARRYTANN